MGHRFYWPDLGRFIQQDPIGDDINWYTYVGNNPLVFIDPEGLVLCGVLERAVGLLEWVGFEGSSTASAYAGRGGTVTIGRNPDGSVFIGGTIGFGSELAWQNDAFGTGPNWNPWVPKWYEPRRRPRGPQIQVSPLSSPRGAHFYRGLGAALGVGAAAGGTELSLFSVALGGGFGSAGEAGPHSGSYGHFAPPRWPPRERPSPGKFGGQVGGHIGLDFGVVCD